jgi:hypothetical protein
MRLLKKEELDLMVYLLKDKPNTKHMIEKLPGALVEEMNDGGMGSLKFLNKNKLNRRHESTIAQIQLLDIDGIPLLISIDLDGEGDIYELDVWKGDSSPTKQFPVPPYNPI